MELNKDAWQAVRDLSPTLGAYLEYCPGNTVVIDGELDLGDLRELVHILETAEQDALK